MKKTFYLLLVTLAFVACTKNNQNTDNENDVQEKKPASINIENSRANKFFVSRENRGNSDNVAIVDTIPANEEIVLADTTTVEPEPVAPAQPAPAATTTTTTRRTTNSSNSNSSSSSSDSSNSSNRRNSNNSSNSSSNSDVSYSGGDSAGDSAGGGRSNRNNSSNNNYNSNNSTEVVESAANRR